MTHTPNRRSLLGNNAVRCLGATVMVLVLVAGPASALEDVVLTQPVNAVEIPGALVKDFGKVVEGQVAVLEIVVSNPGSEPLQIGAVKPLCACMSQESDRRIEPGATGSITLRLETVGYSGPTTEAALIEWIDSTVGLTRVEMNLDVQPIFSVEPRRFLRFRAYEGQPAVEDVTVRRSDGKPFKIEQIESNLDYLDAEAKPVEDHGFRIVATLGPEAPNGILRGVVTLHTDVAGSPTVEIKASGLVAKPKPLPGMEAAID